MGWEASIMRVGSGGIRVLPTADGRIAGAICFDADFPSYIRRAGLGATDLFVLPVNEWRSIKDIHFQMHVFRAIENGMPIVRAAAVGLSAAVDPEARAQRRRSFRARRLHARGTSADRPRSDAVCARRRRVRLAVRGRPRVDGGSRRFGLDEAERRVHGTPSHDAGHESRLPALGRTCNEILTPG